MSISDYLDVMTSVLKIKNLRKRNFPSRPRVIAYTVTWRCNAGCDMCGIKNVNADLKKIEKELTPRDISKIFQDPLLKRLDLIRFTGGEPFLKEDFTEIVDAIIENTRTKIYYITTNGFYTKEVLEFVERLAPKTPNLVIQVSLDAIGKPHDDIRKLPGLYDRVIKTLQGLKALRDRHAFSFGVNQTVTKDTVAFIPDISKLCSNLGCDHKVYLAHEVHESDILDGARLKGNLVLLSGPQKDEIKNLYDKVEEHYRKARAKGVRIFSPEDLWAAAEKAILEGSKNRTLYGRACPNPPCLAMFFYLRLLPDGTVMPCTLKPKPVGNLKTNTFSEIWNSQAAAEMRFEVKSCKGCWVECDIVPNVIYSLGMIRNIFKKAFPL